jgi:putative glycosyltransferase (TIGR04372 family)
LIIPKRLFLDKERRFLSFREIVNSPFGSASTGEFFKRAGVELMENSPQEISAVALEMDERLKGTWREVPGDEELQQSFWKLFEPYGLNNPGVRIGAEFLRQNKSLLV